MQENLFKVAGASGAPPPPWFCCLQSLEIYFQTMHSTVGGYETPSLHTAIEMLIKWEARIVTAMGLGSDPNGAAINQMVQNHPLKA